MGPSLTTSTGWEIPRQSQRIETRATSENPIATTHRWNGGMQSASAEGSAAGRRRRQDKLAVKKTAVERRKPDAPIPPNAESSCADRVSATKEKTTPATQRSTVDFNPRRAAKL